MAITVQGEFSSALTQTCFYMMDVEIDANKHSIVMEVDALFNNMIFIHVEWNGKQKVNGKSFLRNWLKINLLLFIYVYVYITIRMVLFRPAFTPIAKSLFFYTFTHFRGSLNNA